MITLEQAYYIGELVSVAGVIVSLVYVGKQLQQNTKAVRSQTAQNLVDSMFNIHNLVSSSDQMPTLVLKGNISPETLSGDEEVRMTFWMHTIFRTLELAYYQHKDGLLDDKLWQSFIRQYSNAMVVSFPRRYWDERGFFYTEEFQEFISREFLKKGQDARFRFPGMPKKQQPAA
jgi:hypothetical protein